MWPVNRRLPAQVMCTVVATLAEVSMAMPRLMAMLQPSRIRRLRVTSRLQRLGVALFTLRAHQAATAWLWMVRMVRMVWMVWMVWMVRMVRMVWMVWMVWVVTTWVT